jgi:hypothetical protein
MQGFLFSRAVTPAELELWLEQTVLPRKAPWIGVAETSIDGEEARLSGVPTLDSQSEHQRFR